MSTLDPSNPSIRDTATEKERLKRRLDDKVDSIVDSEEIRLCYDIVAHLMAYPHAPPFNEPVNWKLLKLPDYPKVIKSPMDLGTIKNKILCNEIHRVDRFVSLVRLVFKNAKDYNAAGSPIYLDAENLLQTFESMVETAGFADEGIVILNIWTTRL